jgi:hypothetical protein
MRTYRDSYFGCLLEAEERSRNRELPAKYCYWRTLSLAMLRVSDSRCHYFGRQDSTIRSEKQSK